MWILLCRNDEIIAVGHLVVEKAVTRECNLFLFFSRMTFLFSRTSRTYFFGISLIDQLWLYVFRYL